MAVRQARLLLPEASVARDRHDFGAYLRLHLSRMERVKYDSIKLFASTRSAYSHGRKQR